MGAGSPPPIRLSSPDDVKLGRRQEAGVSTNPGEDSAARTP
jgi:hypothetical protein